MKLTQAKIKRFRYQGDPYTNDAGEVNGWPRDVRWDEDLPGFGLRIYPPKQNDISKKSFILTYRVHGRKKLKVLGQYGVITLQQARDKAKKYLAQIIDNEDPFESQNTSHITFKKFSEIYVTKHAKPHKKTWETDLNRIERHLNPRIGNYRLEAIRKSDIVNIHSEIGKKHPYEANRVLALVSVMFTKAQEWEYLDAGINNPAENISKFKEETRDRFVKPEEMPRLAKAINEEKNIYVRAAFWMYLLTGMRKNELLRSKWEWIDWTTQEMRLPDTKAGKVHYVPLDDLALALLENLPRIEGNPYVFVSPVNTDRHLVNIDKNWRRVRKKANLQDIHIHDLRRTVGSWLAQEGIPIKIIGHILGHKRIATTDNVYTRLSQDAGRNALQTHGERLRKYINIQDKNNE